MASLIKQCIFGPKLYRIHAGAVSNQGYDYVPNFTEKQANNIITWMKVCWYVIKYTSPISLTYMYRNGYFTVAGLINIGHCTGIAMVILMGSIIIRGLGRYLNPEYCDFIQFWQVARNSNSYEIRHKLQYFDYEFSHWQEDFIANTDKPPLKLSPITTAKPRSLLSRIVGLPCDLLSYCLIQTVGRWLVYPGHTLLLNAAVAPSLLEGRRKLLENKHGIRAKLIARDGNEIDTMFIDARGMAHSHGDKLVICCEGNGGYYEAGCMSAPQEAKYSILGWNHPGFGGSTGYPFPENEANAIEVVMQYATTELGFHLSDIILYAWSIGGYSASIAAMNYPRVHALILDATFDDLVPLATAKMPEIAEGIIVRTLRKYMNLQVADNVCRYPGPIRLIRRTHDEVITTSLVPNVKSNRGNNLLIALLKYRYPNLLDEESLPVLNRFLSAESIVDRLNVFTEYEVEDSACTRDLQRYAVEHSTMYPMMIGEDLREVTKIQLTLFLAGKYLVDYEAMHCKDLPSSYFEMPWQLE
ncbi:phosphatidylserine lipase ABHD16A-like [Anneissia japonica]|uniref:phosphatidylserine lipase ABHD16A-like n=1 Tax=Anneissia japonica TaxID=1529436 RepID=UPI001425B2B2|nr:phosphatidylserine lipase ABHD16A-like [Anneissia japonica]